MARWLGERCEVVGWSPAKAWSISYGCVSPSWPWIEKEIQRLEKFSRSTADPNRLPTRPMSPAPVLEKVVLDASVLLGVHRSELIALAALRYYTGYWST